ncbi:hypothetical protein [Myroides odoratimimus]|uniref:hypothetical protein n=1 Tax=Myroides odoratimimus TaxID=76832 RepID=UPI002575B2A8|nr:hypothetical protein [Myroides odoratimimus]MDM1513575.1 hypothetical protein [Myroides odoratimimus]
MNTDEKTIYDLKLHESIRLKSKINETSSVTFNVTRVPGGFIYQNYEKNALVFVPYNEEFKNSDNTGNYTIG